MLLIPGFGVFPKVCLTWARISRSVCIMVAFVTAQGKKNKLNYTGNKREVTLDMELNVRT